MSDLKRQLGFVGTGLMGAPMAARLLAAGHAVTVWNRTRAKLVPLVEQGATEGASAAEVAAASDIVFTCLTDTRAMAQAVFGEDGIAAGARKGSYLVDHSSMSPEATREMATRLKRETGMIWIDAPVSGGVPGATAGTLAIMAGGTPEAVEAVRSVVAEMSSRLTHIGPVGAGQTMKLCNQVIVGCTMAVLAEAGRLARNAGVDPNLMPEALAGGFADSKPLQIFLPRMVNAQHNPPLGHVYTILKDLDSVGELSRATTSPAPFTALAAEQFRLLMARGGPRADALEIFKLSAPEKL